MSTAEVQVNGRRESLGVTPHVSALDWLRSQGLTGAKEGCAEGECGACAIMVARPSTTGDGTTEWVSINACLIPAAGLAGQEVVTSEGLGTTTTLHPVQHEMATRGGSQCGYCTPGVIMTAKALLDRNPNPSRDEIREATAGNLCRCTGYQQITEAIEDAAAQLRNEKAL